MNNKEKKEVIKHLMGLAPGPILDAVTAYWLFGIKCDDCSLGGYHVSGAQHYVSHIDNKEACFAPLPAYSTNWDHFKSVMEWMVMQFPGLELVWDSGRWMCNINYKDKKMNWLRLSTISGLKGIMEVSCKASVIALIDPMQLPLDIRFIAKNKIPKFLLESKSGKRKKK